MDEATINGLKKIGLTEYEARAYLVLLNLGQSTAREICEISGIPLSRIYSVMNLLVERGFATTVEGTPTFFIAMDPDPIFTAIRENFCEEINNLRKNLRDSYFEINKSSPYWPIYNDRGIEIMLKNLITSAQKEIMVMVSDPQYIRPHLSLLKAIRRRVELYILVPDKTLFVGMGLRI
jgi:sugar-specific transcriptional regulator TrmB